MSNRFSRKRLYPPLVRRKARFSRYDMACEQTWGPNEQVLSVGVLLGREYACRFTTIEIHGL